MDYYALDLSGQELERTLSQLPRYKRVSVHGLLGTYDDGREWLKEPANLARRKCILTLGSSIGTSSGKQRLRTVRITHRLQATSTGMKHPTS